MYLSKAFSQKSVESEYCTEFDLKYFKDNYGIVLIKQQKKYCANLTVISIFTDDYNVIRITLQFIVLHSLCAPPCLMNNFSAGYCIN